MTVGMIESTKEAVEALKRRVPSSDSATEIEMGAVLSLLALDVIGRTAFGANIGGGSHDAKRVSLALTRLIEGVLELALGGYRLIPFYTWVPLTCMGPRGEGGVTFLWGAAGCRLL